MSSDKSFFGHPKGLATLFFTEMWERFSYYGMRALLILFMVASVEEGGMGLDEKISGSIYGLYTMFVYLLALPGGWLADKYFGLRNSIFYGGILITIGHFCLAFPMPQTFFLGLAFIVLGTGLLKPNASALVGELYPAEEPARRDAGFSIFYMGINIGAFIAPLITSYLGEIINWHYGFAVAGIGMLIGTVQYKLTENNLGQAGIRSVENDPNRLERHRKIRNGLWLFAFLFALLVILLFTGVFVINPVAIAKVSTYVIGGASLLYFLYVILFENLDSAERKKIGVIGIFFLTACFFYAGYEQQGSSLNLFGERYTNRFFGDWEMPAGYLQSVSPIVVVIFSPIFAWLWIWLAKRKLDPSTPIKLALGVVCMGLGYVVMMGASLVVVGGALASPSWLLATYTIHTIGEILLYPVGLSAVTKLSPKRLVGQMMGLWFMSLALGNLVAGLFAGEFDANAIQADPQIQVDLFWTVARAMIIPAVIVIVFNKPIRKLMGTVR